MAKKMPETIPEVEKGGNHWLLQKGYQLKLDDNPSLLLCKMECESWLELMTANDIETVLNEIDALAFAFDEQRVKDPEIIPEYLAAGVEEMPLSVKIEIAYRRGLCKGVLMTRQHLLAAAYRCMVHDYHMWETVIDKLETAALNADEQGYHISVLYNPHEVFRLMCEVSALLALASHADIAKNGVMNIGDVVGYTKSSQARKNQKKGNSSYNENKRKSIEHFQKEHSTTGISKNEFARKYHKKYSVTEEVLRNTLKGK